MKKILSIALVVVLLAGIAVSGTMAYLTDTDSAVNVMTLGNVDIEQIEQEWNEDKSALQDFTQAKPLYPYVGTLGWENEGEADGAYRRFTMENVVDKYVSVMNTGKSDAYVRTVIALEMGEFTYEEFKDIGISINAENGSEFKFPGAWEWTDDFVAEIDGKNYNVMVAVHKDAVAPGETTIPSLLQVYLSKDADNEEVAKLDGNGNGTYDILVLSQAVQTAGFENAAEALEAAFPKGTDNVNVPTWFGDMNVPVVVEDADGLIEALENGKDVIMANNIKIDPAGMSNAYGKTGINVKKGQTIDGNGNTLDIKGAGGTWDSGICTSGGLIKDITVTGSFRGIFIKKDTVHNERVILENVIIDGTTYTISVDSGTGKGLTATDSTFNGWTSYAGTLGDVEFINCKFGAGAGYNFSRPYAPTTYVNCEFAAGHKLDARAAVTFENCTIGGVALTADNLATLVTSNIANATVK